MSNQMLDPLDSVGNDRKSRKTMFEETSSYYGGDSGLGNYSPMSGYITSSRNSTNIAVPQGRKMVNYTEQVFYSTSKNRHAKSDQASTYTGRPIKSSRSPSPIMTEELGTWTNWGRSEAYNQTKSQGNPDSNIEESLKSLENMSPMPLRDEYRSRTLPTGVEQHWAADYAATCERARSVSPQRGSSLSSRLKKVNFVSEEDLSTSQSREQEFYPFRDAHQGKPLPGDNEFGTWGSGLNEPERQWRLSNGQWVKVGPKRKRDGDDDRGVKNWEKHLADTLRGPPTPVRKEPEKRKKAAGKPAVETPNRSDLDDDDDADANRRALADEYRPKSRSGPVVDVDSDKVDPNDVDGNNNNDNTGAPLDGDNQHDTLPDFLKAEPEYKVNVGDLIDKYQPKPKPEPVVEAPVMKPKPKPVVQETPKPKPKPTKIALEPIKQTFIEARQPIRPPEPEEKPMDDPNLMWMKMDPAQFGPPFGSLGRRKKRHEEWVGVPCELCHKQIDERRCMLAENMKFHCWHFSCSFCLKTLKVNDFLIAQSDQKPYCLNCHKRTFPEVSLLNLNLDTGEE
ncbi:hypothetical protein GZH46_02709 [Fragariocoptes setiger]|uniref:LIM zinc-binding domain-containing protein n=1 Tax=Fragariocoptes setiger TaxID=1670756 RepID=A0ABQ7S5T5_9ACAR|nr:hypothetical protein GZH46_02709 [Fragariocoptes setiger]